MEVNGQLHAPAALDPRKELPVPIGLGGWLDTTVGLDVVEMRKNLCTCWELNPDRPARSLAIRSGLE